MKRLFPIALVAAGFLLLVTSPTVASAASTQSSARVPSTLWNINMLNAHDGFVSGYQGPRFYLWSTDDGGAKWIRLAVPGAPMMSPSWTSPPTVMFRTPKDGWVSWVTVGKASSTLVVLHSTTGGHSWQKYEAKVPSVVDEVLQIDFISLRTGWIRTMSFGASEQADPSIFHTGNGGRTWSLVSSTGGYVPNRAATPDALPGFDVPMPMTFTNAKDGWAAVGNFVATQNSLATLYHTTTAGRRWYPVQLPVPKPLKHGFATIEYQPVFSGQIGTVLIEYEARTNHLVAYHTVNGGKSWSVGSILTFRQSTFQMSESFVNPQIGWVIGQDGTDDEVTRDHGVTWSHIPVRGALRKYLTSHYQVDQLNMVSEKSGWMLLRKGTGVTKLLKTSDGGVTWVAQRW